MAHFLHNTPIHNYAEAYMARCKEIQKLANSDPSYKPTSPPDDDSSSVIVIDDDDDANETSRLKNDTHPSFGLRELLLSSPIASPPNINIDSLNKLPTYDESTDLHITGVSVLREWIDISELDVKRHAQLRACESNGSAGCGPRRKKRKKNGEDRHVATIETESRIGVKGSEKNDDVEVVGEINANWADVDVEEEVEEEQECEVVKKRELEPEPDEQCSNDQLESEKGRNEKAQETESSSKSDDSDSSGDKFKCDHCSYSTNWKSNMNKHVVSRHQADKDIRWLQCAHCPYKGKTREYLRSHLRQNHDKFTWVKCLECPLQFKSEQRLKMHHLNVHTPPDEIKWLQCDQCPYKCKYKRNLKDHKLCKHTAPTDISWFRCKSCPYMSKTSGRLRSHMMIHPDYKRFKCERCGLRTSNEWLLKEHMKEYHQKAVGREVQGGETVKECGSRLLSKDGFSERFGCVAVHRSQ